MVFEYIHEDFDQLFLDEDKVEDDSIKSIVESIDLNLKTIELDHVLPNKKISESIAQLVIVQSM